MTRTTMKMTLGAALCLTLGWLGSTVERTASAQVQPPSAARVGEWVDMGEANGVQAFRFSDSGHICYVTTPNGGISCGR